MRYAMGCMRAGSDVLTEFAQLCLLLAQSGHRDALSQCPLLGVKRTFPLRSLLMEIA